jgi:hypothetical protein
MASSIDVELILRTIDEARPECQQKFTRITVNERMQIIWKLFYNSTLALIRLSISGDDNEQTKQDRLNAERIVSKLKELTDSLSDLWPSNMDHFGRDVFYVGTRHIVADEFFHPVPFYPGLPVLNLTKIYRWSVYDANGTNVCYYHLERSEMVPEEPYYVLGKSYPNGHCQIQPYGATAPDYNQMKSHVINHLMGQGPQPVISLSVHRASNDTENYTKRI